MYANYQEQILRCRRKYSMSITKIKVIYALDMLTSTWAESAKVGTEQLCLTILELGSYEDHSINNMGLSW